ADEHRLTQNPTNPLYFLCFAELPTSVIPKQYVTFNYYEKWHIFSSHSDLPHEKTRSISPARKLPLGSRARSREIKISRTMPARGPRRFS
ncbi:hypothetical protein KAW18_15430, partial [candidate division WOR-3 bacterium]|nr:hypothetical protein [candidate division WOR-3 bacterium]